MHYSLISLPLQPPSLLLALKDTKFLIALAVGVFPSAVPDPWANLTQNR